MKNILDIKGMSLNVYQGNLMGNKKHLKAKNNNNNNNNVTKKIE